MEIKQNYRNRALRYYRGTLVKKIRKPDGSIILVVHKLSAKRLKNMGVYKVVEPAFFNKFEIASHRSTLRDFADHLLTGESFVVELLQKDASSKFLVNKIELFVMEKY